MTPLTVRVLICLSITILLLGGFIYAIIWLNDGFNADQQIASSINLQKKIIEEDLRKDFVLKSSLMPACFINQTTDGSHRSKRY